MSTQTIPDALAASVQHLELLIDSIGSLRAKVARLEDARTETLAQIAAASKRVTQEWSSSEMLALYERLNSPGFFTAWKAAGLPHPSRLKADVEMAERYRPNDPASGGWVGEWIVTQHSWGPVGHINGPHPGSGVPVVYVLYGPDASPVYCGSSERFAKRLDQHHRAGKEFVAWRAVPCLSREDAYKLEDDLLRQHCPPLNKRAGR